jgi:hypothetical protein
MQNRIHFADLPRDFAGWCRVFLPRPVHGGPERTGGMALWQDDFTADKADCFQRRLAS